MSQQSVNINIPSIQNKPVVFAQNNVPPAMQGGIDQEKVRQTVDNNYIANRARASKDTNPFALLGLGTALWYGIGQTMEKLNPKFGGDYEKSIGGKVGAFGDRISNTWLGKKVGSFLDWVKGKADHLDTKKAKNGSPKHKIIYSLRHHSTSPEWKFAKMPANGLLGFLAVDTEQVIESFMEPIGGKIQKLQQYGVDASQLETLKKNLAGKPTSIQHLAIQKLELEQLGADAKIVERIAERRGLSGLQEYAKYLKTKEFGLSGIKEFNKLKVAMAEHPEEVQKMLDSIAGKHPNWKVSIWKGDGGVNAGPVKRFLNKIRTHFFGRDVRWTEYRNKWKIATGNGAQSRFGKFLTKSMGWLLEGSTNRFAGGKLVVAMQAGIFADMLINTFKAPKGEKGKTFAERFVNDFTYFIGLTAGILAMHKVGGFKYAGLDEAGKAAYKKALKKFNFKNDNGLFKDKAARKAAKKALDKMLGSKNIKNPITKLLHRAARIINWGNERVHSYVSKSKYNMNWLRKLKNGNLLGVPIRILIPMAVVTPFLVKLTTTAAHKLFGRPTHSVLDEEEDENNQEKEAQALGNQPPFGQNIDASQKPQFKNPQDYQSDTNLIKMAANGQYPSASQVATATAATTNAVQNDSAVTEQQPVQPKDPQDYQSDTNLIKMTANGEYPAKSPERTYVPSSDSVFNQGSNTVTTTTTTITNGDSDEKTELEPTRTYIPSPECVVKNNTDLTAAEKALADADNAEKFVNETLAQING